MNNKILLLFLFIFLSASAIIAQNIAVTGTVTSEEDGEPLIGVTVTVKGNPSVGASTDIDGKFNLTVPSNVKVLVFSYVGMVTKELPIQPVMNVALAVVSYEMDEVVVTGYQKIDRKLFTGAASVVKGENAKIDGVADVSRMLQGKAAGVQLTNVSGTFGASPKLRVRGASSIYGSSAPLWVVDGVILDEIVNVSASDLSSGNASTLISSAVAGLNADDIETFQILKDASATALYGSKAMNGVIVITTKKGKKGVASINYTGEFTMRTKPYYGQYDILNSQDQMSVFLELEQNGGLESATSFLAKDGGVFSKWYQMEDQRRADGSYDAISLQREKMLYLQQAELRNTDWFNELFRNTLQQNHSVSITSGTDKTSNYTSLSYFNDPGWTAVDKVNRFTFNTNTSYNISKKLTAGILGSASIRNQRAPGTLDRRVNVVEGEYSRDFDINPFSYGLNSSRTMAADEFYRRNYADFNIKHEMENNYMQIDLLDTKLQIDLSYKPIKELELSMLGTVRYVKTSKEHRILNKSNMAEAYRAAQSSVVQDNNNFLWHNPDRPDDPPVVVMPNGGFFNVEDNSLYSYSGRVSANYMNSFNDSHIVNFLGGMDIRTVDRMERFNNGYGYLWGSDVAVTDFRVIRKILDGDDAYYGMVEAYDRQLGFFGTGTYSYQGTYTLNATIRTEGTNQMGRTTTARWLPTWNISGSWNVMNESFMKSQNVLTGLTLRATYGLTAKMAPRANAMAIYRAANTFRPFQDDREVMLYISSLENRELTWEKMYEANVGLDVRLLKNRFSISVDAYSRDAFDLIGPVRTGGLGGAYLKYANFADMKSTGFEFIINTTNIEQKNFKWTSNLTFSYNTNKITNLKSNSRVIDLVGLEAGIEGFKEGYSQSSLFSIPFAGLNDKGHPVFLDEKGEKTHYIDLQNSIQTDYLKYEGQIDPKFIGGFENSFTYKNFGLDLFFTYQGGNVIRLYPTFSATYSDIDAMTQDMNNRWVIPGDEHITNVPVIPSVYELRRNNDLINAYNAYNFTSVRVAKGDFIRLKDITLSYTFDRELVNKIGLNSLQIRCVASNLWLIYSDKALNGQDPEFSRSGGVAMPTPRQFTLSLRTSF